MSLGSEAVKAWYSQVGSNSETRTSHTKTACNPLLSSEQMFHSNPDSQPTKCFPALMAKQPNPWRRQTNGRHVSSQTNMYVLRYESMKYSLSKYRLRHIQAVLNEWSHSLETWREPIGHCLSPTHPCFHLTHRSCSDLAITYVSCVRLLHNIMETWHFF